MFRCGSGEVTQYLVSVLPQAYVLTIDVNSLATSKTLQLLKPSPTENIAHSTVDVLTTDLFTAFRNSTKFDLILFNPPYVPTDADELARALNDRDISASWAGGPNGRFLIDRFLVELPNYLSPTSLAYVVLIHENQIEEVLTTATGLGLSTDVVMKRLAGIESLYTIRFKLFSKG